MKKRDLDYIFSCYNKKVTVVQAEAITSGEENAEAAAPVKAAAPAGGSKPSGKNKKKKKK